MHSSKQIKICKVESKSFAKYCIARGADYLGIHVIDFELSDEYAELCRYISTKGGRVVLLTKERDVNRLTEMVSFYQPWALQLHYSLNNNELAVLSDKLAVPLVPVITDDTELEDVRTLIAVSEFVIYDTSFRGGTGTVHTRKHLSLLNEGELKKVLLAGGVTPTLIQELKDTALGGFDVQSFCRENGRHHYGKAKQLFDITKGHERRQLSVSLTDVLDITTIPAYEDIASLEYQVDFSEGNLYDHFKVDSERILEVASTVDAPVTLHIFEASVQVFQQVVDMFMKVAANNIVRINIQYSKGLDVDAIDVYNAVRCASLYYKDLPAYFAQYPILHDCVSLILPSELPRKSETLLEYAKEIELLKTKEVWFDRKVDLPTMQLVLSADPEANFIAGEYILENWDHEDVLIKELAYE